MTEPSVSLQRETQRPTRIVPPAMPSNIPLENGMSTQEFPLPPDESGERNEEREFWEQQGYPYRIVDDFHNAVEKPEGFRPTLTQANDYALKALNAAYPADAPIPKIRGFYDVADGYDGDRYVEKAIAGIPTYVLREEIKKAAVGEISQEAVALHASVLIDGMKITYGRYIIEWLIEPKLREAYHGHLEQYEKYLKPEALVGPEIEQEIIDRLIRTKHRHQSLGNDYLPGYDLKGQVSQMEFEAMKFLGHYRSFVLAGEIVSAAREQRPVNRVLVEKLWQANNARRADVKWIRSHSQIDQYLAEELDGAERIFQSR